MAPRVSVVIPARNEAAYIEACVQSVLRQHADGGMEIIVVDGESSDETAARARAAGARVIENPRRITPTALNYGLAAARGEFLLRFDAHSEMGEGYIDACLRAHAEEEGAANVGGWCEIQGVGPWGHAVAVALTTPFGVGNPRLWRRPAKGEGRRDAETVPFGSFPTQVLRDLGGWNEALVRNQDFELNHRLRAAGSRIVFDPAVWFIYRPRESLGALWRQYWDFGRWKAVVLAGAPRSLKPRQLAPLGLVAATVASLLPFPGRRPARIALTAYTGVLAAVTARSQAGWRTLPVLAVMHFAWGLGVVCSLGGLLGRRLSGVHQLRPERT